MVGAGAEKVLTKNGSSFVAIVDARKLDYYHALENVALGFWARPFKKQTIGNRHERRHDKAQKGKNTGVYK